MARLKVYSRAKAIAKLDGRTCEAKLLRETRLSLAEHLGGNPTATQRALIDRAAWLTLHMAQLDRKAADGGGLTEHDSRTYLAWSNSLTRTLTAIGMKAAQPRAKTLPEHLAERAQAA